MIHNQRGSLTLDFIFAFLLVFSISFILTSVSFTLSVVESIQYMAFSASRDYFAGHINKEKQEGLAQKKFDDLKKDGSYKNLLKKEWFDVKYIGSGDFKGDYSSSDPKDIFQGSKLQVTIGFLNFNLPFFGSTEGDQPYVANVTSFIGREPTSEECMGVVNSRFDKLLSLDGYATGSLTPNYVKFDDNGC